MSAHLDSTYGAAFIGMVVAGVLHGVSCVQALYYYTTQNDSWLTKHSVTAILIFDTVHQALITHTVYTYTVTDWGNPTQLVKIVWSLLIEVIFTAITAFIVQGFLTLRVWRLSNNNKYITGSCVMLAASGFLNTLVYVAKGLRLENLAELDLIKGESLAVNILGAATDLLIAGTLCTIFSLSRTGFHRTDVLINRLILFSVNTGLLTSLCALASLISILAAPNTFIYIAFFFCLGRLYTNSLLATLNARKMLRGTESRSVDAMSVSLRDLAIKHLPRSISVKIDTTTTTTQEYRNGTQRLDESCDSEAAQVGVPYDEEDGRKGPLIH
jgi:hypothetical protein